MTPGEILAVGNLSLDLVGHAQKSSGDVARLLGRGENVLVDVSAELRLGGGAYLFALAAKEATGNDGLLIASVGADPLGDVLVAGLQQRGLSTSALLRTLDAPTPVIPVTYFDENVRLIVTPHPSANDSLTAEWACRVAERSRTDRGQPALLWISGYALRRPGSARFGATQALVAWARKVCVPTFLDLVPHDFIGSISSLEQVLERLGSLTGVVAEHETVVGLAAAPPNASLGDAAVGLASAAGALAIVQRKLDRGVYGQAVADASGVAVERYAYDEAHERGLGDRLAVDALKSLGFLVD